MARGASQSHLVPHLLGRLFRKRETIAYPHGPLVLPDVYRGRVAVDVDRCIGCGRCARACPSTCLLVERLASGGVRVTLHHDRCASCGLCVVACPTEAILLQARLVGSAVSRSQLCEILTREGDTVPNARGQAK